MRAKPSAWRRQQPPADTLMMSTQQAVYLDEAFELVVLGQELRLLLLQGEDVVCRLLQDGRLRGMNPKVRRALRFNTFYWNVIRQDEHFHTGDRGLKTGCDRVCVCVCLHLAEFLSVRVRQERFEGLEAGVDALHAPALVAVGDLAADSSLLVLHRLRTERDVGQAEWERERERERIVVITSANKQWKDRNRKTFNYQQHWQNNQVSMTTQRSYSLRRRTDNRNRNQLEIF